MHRAINKPIEFKGIKGFYIVLLGLGMLILLLLISLLYLLKLPNLFLTALGLLLGGAWLLLILHINKRFGQYGLQKYLARKRLPKAYCIRQRRSFYR